MKILIEISYDEFTLIVETREAAYADGFITSEIDGFIDRVKGRFDDTMQRKTNVARDNLTERLLNLKEQTSLRGATRQQYAKYSDQALMMVARMKKDLSREEYETAIDKMNAKEW